MTVDSSRETTSVQQRRSPTSEPPCAMRRMGRAPGSPVEQETARETRPPDSRTSRGDSVPTISTGQSRQSEVIPRQSENIQRQSENIQRQPENMQRQPENSQRPPENVQRQERVALPTSIRQEEQKETNRSPEPSRDIAATSNASRPDQQSVQRQYGKSSLNQTSPSRQEGQRETGRDQEPSRGNGAINAVGGQPQRIETGHRQDDRQRTTSSQQGELQVEARDERGESHANRKGKKNAKSSRINQVSEGRDDRPPNRQQPKIEGRRELRQVGATKLKIGGTKDRKRDNQIDQIQVE